MTGTNGLYDGYDGGSVVYDKKQDRKHESAVWKLLLLIFSIAFLVTAVLHIDELKLYFTGTAVTGEYDEKYRMAEVRDENGERKLIYVGKAYVSVRNGKVTLYYTDGDISSAEALTTPVFWLFSYGFSGFVAALSIRKIYKVYKK